MSVGCYLKSRSVSDRDARLLTSMSFLLRLGMFCITNEVLLQGTDGVPGTPGLDGRPGEIGSRGPPVCLCVS